MLNFTFQWHITDICNFRCKHCYQEDYAFEGLECEKIYLIYKNIIQFIDYLEHKNGQTVNLHINFTGGEPFMRTDFIEIIQKMQQLKHFSFVILSNGYLTSEHNLLILKTLKPRFIQISLDGDKNMNDFIRGSGSYEKIIEALIRYNQLKIPVIISFTANAQNYTTFPKVVSIAQKYKCKNVWTDRYLPINKTDALMLDTAQTQDFFRIIQGEQQKFRMFSKIKIKSERALQFLVCGGVPYICKAAQSIFTILANGELLPCRRLPVTLGDCLRQSIIDIYENAEFIKEIKNAVLSNDCLKCFYFGSCNGGLKCLTYAVKNLLTHKDINCWI